MPRTLTRLTLAALAASLCVTAAATAQTTLGWIVLSPAGEKFTARVPKQPTVSDESVEAGALKASGRRYADDGTTFAVWVMKGSHGSTRLDEIDHGMGYTREFALSGRPAREYRVWVEKAHGAVYVVADESGAYVVAALGPRKDESALRSFLDSFALQNAPPASRIGGRDAPPGAGVGPGGARASERGRGRSNTTAWAAAAA